MTREPIVVAGRRLEPSPVFDTYWRFAAARQALYEARLIGGLPGCPAHDSILGKYRFTNCFRAADRVSQYLIGRVIYRGDQSPHEVFFRTLLFKFFNRISTWEVLERELGELTWSTFSVERFNSVLTRAVEAGGRLYSPAYVIPPPRIGGGRKHHNHLLLLEHLMLSRITEQVCGAKTMADAFRRLRNYPSIGDFLGFQFLIDLNYSDILAFDEMEFVVAGPGARDGIRKCFGPTADGIETQVIHYMAEHQSHHFERLGMHFAGLRGRRPLKLVDCQNLFCETDKYSRLAHPDIPGRSNRARIKQLYHPLSAPLTAWFPPKWGLNGPASETE